MNMSEIIIAVVSLYRLRKVRQSLPPRPDRAGPCRVGLPGAVPLLCQGQRGHKRLQGRLHRLRALRRELPG